MIGAGRDDPAAAGPRHDAELGDDVLPRVHRGKILPEGKTTHVEELLPVVQHAAARPGDTIDAVVGRRDAELSGHVQQIGGVVHAAAAPSGAARLHTLGSHRALPELDGLLMRPHVVTVAQTHDGAPDESALFAADHAHQSLDQVGFQDHVVVEEQHVRRLRLAEQEVPVLGQPQAREVTQHVRLHPSLAQHAEHCDELTDPHEQLGVFRLVGHGDAQPPVGLGHDAREGDGQRGGTVPGRDKDVHPGRSVSPSPTPLERLAPRSVVVLRALPGLGDMICAVPALRALRAALPAAHISLLTLPANSVLFARYPGLVDGLLPFPGFPGLPEVEVDPPRTAAFFLEAQAARFDLVVQLHGSGAYTNQFVSLLAARRTAGFYLPGQFCPDEELFLPYPAAGAEIRRLLALTSFLGAPSHGDALEFPLEESDLAGLDDLLPGGAEAFGDYAVVHPGAKEPRRRWPAGRFAAAGDLLAEKGLRVVITGGAGETGLTAAVAQAMRQPALELAGRTTLGTLAALLSRARLLVANDTGVSHLAAALRTPSVVVFSASESERWAPLDDRLHRVVDGLAGAGPFDTGDRCLREACLHAPWNRPGYGRGPSLEAVLEQVARMLTQA